MGVRNATNLNGMIGRSFDHIFDASKLTFTLFVLVYFSRLNLIISELCTASMAIGGGFFDQYSVFCVFGSVVGCVVVPLITQVKVDVPSHSSLTQQQHHMVLYSKVKS